MRPVPPPQPQPFVTNVWNDIKGHLVSGISRVVGKIDKSPDLLTDILASLQSEKSFESQVSIAQSLETASQ